MAGAVTGGTGDQAIKPTTALESVSDSRASCSSFTIYIFSSRAMVMRPHKGGGRNVAWMNTSKTGQLSTAFIFRLHPTRSPSCLTSGAMTLRHLLQPPAIQEISMLMIFLFGMLSVNIPVNRPQPRMLRPCLTTKMKSIALLGHSLCTTWGWKGQQVGRNNLRPGMHHQVRVMFSDQGPYAKIDAQAQPGALMVIHRKGLGILSPGKRSSSLSML